MGKGRPAHFSPKCRAIIPLSKEYFPFSHVEPFGYDNTPNKGTVTYLAKFKAIFPSPRKYGGKATNPVTEY